MESPQTALRLRAILGKFPVTKVERGLTGIRFTLSMGNSVFITCDMPTAADVKVGDILTLYTEVLADANLGKPPIQ